MLLAKVGGYNCEGRIVVMIRSGVAAESPNGAPTPERDIDFGPTQKLYIVDDSPIGGTGRDVDATEIEGIAGIERHVRRHLSDGRILGIEDLDLREQIRPTGDDLVVAEGVLDVARRQPSRRRCR